MKYYRCEKCGWYWNEDELHKDMYGMTDVCPNCNSIDLDEGYRCKECDKWFAVKKIDDLDLCDDCLSPKRKRS